MESDESTVQHLRVKFEAVRESASAAEVRAAALDYYKARAAEGATQDEIACELGLSRWTLAKWHQLRERRSKAVGSGGLAPSSAESVDCAALRQEIEGLGPRNPSRRFPEELKNRVAQWARGELGRGVRATAVAEQVGIPWESISRWLRARTVASATAAKLRPVRLVGSAPAVAGGGAGRPVLRSPRGFTVEGLDLPALVELLRQLG